MYHRVLLNSGDACDARGRDSARCRRWPRWCRQASRGTHPSTRALHPDVALGCSALTSLAVLRRTVVCCSARCGAGRGRCCGQRSSRQPGSGRWRCSRPRRRRQRCAPWQHTGRRRGRSGRRQRRQRRRRWRRPPQLPFRHQRGTSSQRLRSIATTRSTVTMRVSVCARCAQGDLVDVQVGVSWRVGEVMRATATEASTLTLASPACCQRSISLSLSADLFGWFPACRSSFASWRTA